MDFKIEYFVWPDKDTLFSIFIECGKLFALIHKWKIVRFKSIHTQKLL